MTGFWIVAASLVALALAFVLRPLLARRPESGAGAGRDETNLAVYRDQLKELAVDLAAGTLAREQYDEARLEIERRMLADLAAPNAAARMPAPSRRAAIAVGVGVPVVATLLYLALGNPGALAPEALRDDRGFTLQQIETMVDRLAARLQENPDNLQGWIMLGRSYAVLNRYPEAVAAYANAVRRSPPDAQLLADYADALAMSQGRRLQGEPERLIAQALKIDPANVKALALAGTAAFERKDFRRAIAYWERILKLLPSDSEMAAAVRDSIADARALAGSSAKKAPAPKAAAPAAASVSGTVRLAPSLAARASPDDTVFVFARPAEGSRMPVAVMRKRVRDLPAAFRLDDSMSMAQGAKLSEQARVVVGARVSRNGNAVPQPGDLEGYSAPVKPGDTGVIVLIGTVVR